MPATHLSPDTKIVITGAAGLVGQNLILRLKGEGCRNLVGIDKHPANTPLLARTHTDILEVIQADLGRDGGWQAALEGADALVIMHAQIGSLHEAEFIANNVTATERLLAAARDAGVPYLVHAGSSVVNSQAVDFYTETKKAQERLVIESGIPHAVLRPTLMFGWFDRKHLGWLARFMGKAPVFPVPGSGRYVRQPLFAGDFCDIIVACLRERLEGEWNISGQEHIQYVDLIRAIGTATGARAPVIRIPYHAFYGLLWLYARFDRNPPFTTEQLEALVIPEEFEIIDWPEIFGVRATPLREALEITFNDPRYSHVTLEF